MRRVWTSTEEADVLILSPAYPPQIDGVGGYTRQLKRALQKQGIRAQVLTGGRRPLKSEDGVMRIPLHWHPVGVARAARTAAASGARVVIVQYVPHAFGRGGLNPSVVLLPWLLRQTGLTVITTCHELWVLAPSQQKWGLAHAARVAAERLQRWQTGAVLRASHAVVTTNPWYRERLVSEVGLPTDKVTVIPVGSNIDVAPLSPAERAQLRRRLFPGDPFVIGTLSRLHGWQSPEGVIRAVAEVRAGRRLALLAIGDGPEHNPSLYRSLCDLAAALGVADHVHWTGALPEQEASHHLSAADVFYLPSAGGVSARNTSVMAALQHGVPVMAPAVERGEWRFRSEHQVWLTAGTSGPNIASAALALSERPEILDRLATEGRRLYEAEFAWDRIGAAYGRLCADLPQGR